MRSYAARRAPVRGWVGRLIAQDFVRAFDAYFRNYMPQETTKASPSRVPAPYYTEEPEMEHVRVRLPPTRCAVSDAPPTLRLLVPFCTQPGKRIFTEEGPSGRRQGQRPPTAVMTHGDIIAWSHGETELEQAEHQPHGKHHSLQKKVEVCARAESWERGRGPVEGSGHNRGCGERDDWTLTRRAISGHAAIERHSCVGRDCESRAG